jgi:hypothetical protein
MPSTVRATPGEMREHHHMALLSMSCQRWSIGT